MASQQPPTRSWFRFASMTRPTAPTPTPTTLGQTQRPAPRPMPPFVRPTFRPPVAQPQAPAPPPTPPVAAAPPATTLPPPQPPSPVAAPPPATSFVPSSPIIKVSASSSSLPTSPAYASKESPIPSAAYTSSSVPPSPTKKVVSTSSSSLPTSPAPKLMSQLAPPSHISATTITAVSASGATPKIISPWEKTPPLSPPSPLFLPPAQIKFDGKPQTKSPLVAEQKTIVMQETFEESKVIPNTSKDHKCFYKKYSDSADFGKRVIIIAGENRGAVMELSPSRKKNDTDRGEKSESDSNEEGKSKMKDRTHKMVSPLKTTYMNSNVQGVNNSILFNSSFTHHDPGLHLSLSGKPNGGRTWSSAQGLK